MLNVTILAVGKIKEKFLSDAIDEYSKRLGRYCRLEIIRVKDDPTPDNPTDKERDIVLKREGERLIEKIPKGAYIIPLCIEGKQKSSEEFAKIMSDIPSGGKSEVVFIIGGSMGLWDRIKRHGGYKAQLFENDLSAPTYVRDFIGTALSRIQYLGRR